jgi:hypothetical protein
MTGRQALRYTSGPLGLATLLQTGSPTTMVTLTFFDLIPLWGKVVFTIALVLLSIYGGLRLATARHRHGRNETEGTIGPAVGASLGLLAFLLAFTFGLAASRYDARKTLLIDDVNAIGTLYLRASLLPSPHDDEVRAIVRQYVDLRIAVSTEHMPIAEGLSRSTRLQEQLWSHITLLAAADPHSTVLPLFITAANEVIDLQTKRATLSLQYRIPPVIWLAMFLVSALSMAAMGYHFGLGAGTVGWPVILIITMTFTTVVYLIADLDSAQEGVIRSVSQQPMIELQQQINADRPKPLPSKP